MEHKDLFVNIKHFLNIKRASFNKFCKIKSANKHNKFLFVLVSVLWHRKKGGKKGILLYLCDCSALALAIIYEKEVLN